MIHLCAGKSLKRAARLCAWLVVSSAFGGAWFVASGDDIPVCSTRNLGGRLVYATGKVDIPVPPERAYDVVTDYVHLPEFVTAMDSCIVLSRDSLGALVRQVGTAQLLVRRSIRMTLRFTEERPSRLRFEIVSGDFPIYYGKWEFEPSPTGTVLGYSVTMRPPTFVPTWLVRPSIEKTLCRTLSQTRREIERRAALVADPSRARQGMAR